MEKSLFEVKPVDRDFYQERLEAFLPARMIDIHTHVWRRGFEEAVAESRRRVVSWPSRVARDNPVEDLLETYRLLLPGKEVTPLIFATLNRLPDLEAANEYVSRSAGGHALPSLIFAQPAWSGSELDERIRAGGFIGAKVYLSFAPDYLPADEIRIFDFIPPHQLEALDRRGRLLMLHLPRPGRLKDPVNLAQLLELEARYPRLRVVVAHVGRAYCPEDVGPAFEVLASTRRLLFDISANTNAWVFERLLRAVGPERVLFGSDLPITRMRMRRICEGGRYINLVPAGLYGDVSGDPNLREVSGPEAERLTFFLYEELDAFRQAARAVGLDSGGIEAVCYRNARNLLDEVSATPRPQLQMVWRGDRPERPRRPDRYRLRSYRPGDEAGYVELMRSAGFQDWDRAAEVLRRAIPEGLLFLVERRTGRLVGTAACLHAPLPGQPGRGELGWVAVDPGHTGRGLGRLVCAAALRRFLKSGYRNLQLYTDDFRLPAVKIYLGLGFVPLLDGPGLEERWRAVCGQLGLDPDRVLAAAGRA
ncbi:MAG TPA: GNAT family N-acetyltransferase [bacterium]|uniref:Mycothiol acetyltransferase n=1 Tax=candidate division TA06 bacterium ADurb.Bin417 TaxID=1852828 RepID=A0A1V5MIK6_UNCT6|nr:MAG: Mycothiol acetyltransferase [candidate division TA06 bacterium ADurb.Bin417]HNS49089.1 GNAT family N-acetyltransferase [bacterium]